MKNFTKIAVCACLALILNGCGSSSSSEPVSGPLTTQTIDNTFCTNNPQDVNCQSNQNQLTQQTGIQGYPTNSNGQYLGQDTGLFNNGGCHCPRGTQVAFDDQGSLYCGTFFSQHTRTTSLRFRFVNGKAKKVVFEVAEDTFEDETRVNPTGSCQQNARKVCRNHSSCSGIWLQGAQAHCSQIVGQSYGYCAVSQTL